MTDKFCKYKDGIWICKSKVWEDQKEGCSVPRKSKSRGYCMHYCEDARCDNIDAHGEV